MSSCTLVKIQNHFLRISGECALESYRCRFPILIGTVILSSSFTHPVTSSVHCWCLSTERCVGLCPCILSDLYLEDRLMCPVSGRLHLVLLKLTNPVSYVLRNIKTKQNETKLLMIENSNNVKVKNCTMNSQVPLLRVSI